VLEEDFRAEADEDKAAEGLDFVFEEVAEFAADPNAQVRQNKGYYADDYHSNHYTGYEKRKCHPNGEGIDTGSNRENQQDKDIRWVEILLSRSDFERLINHFDADRAQEGKCYPMVVVCNVLLYGHSGNQG